LLNHDVNEVRKTVCDTLSVGRWLGGCPDTYKSSSCCIYSGVFHTSDTKAKCYI